jgi:hypothetical protein
MVAAFGDADCDTLGECEGIDPILDIVLREDGQIDFDEQYDEEVED